MCPVQPPLPIRPQPSAASARSQLRRREHVRCSCVSVRSCAASACRAIRCGERLPKQLSVHPEPLGAPAAQLWREQLVHPLPSHSRTGNTVARARAHARAARGLARAAAATASLQQLDDDIVVRALQEHLALEADKAPLLRRPQRADQRLKHLGAAIIVEERAEAHACLAGLLQRTSWVILRLRLPGLYTCCVLEAEMRTDGQTGAKCGIGRMRARA
jgi:hypothetical protein